jgi:3-phenylpropionate/cinnamic acid dioxygenase small subunit
VQDADVAVARDSIRDLAARYAHAADRGRFDDVATLFAADAVLEMPDGRRLVGPASVKAFLVETSATMRVAATPGSFIRHHVSSHQITVETADRAIGHAYFFVVTDRGPDHWGRYSDRYVRTADGWRFAERRVRLDGFAPQSHAADRRR